MGKRPSDKVALNRKKYVEDRIKLLAPGKKKPNLVWDKSLNGGGDNKEHSFLKSAFMASLIMGNFRSMGFPPLLRLCIIFPFSGVQKLRCEKQSAIK